MLKKAAVVGIAGLVLGASPAAAGSIGDGETAALTLIGGGGLMGIGCMAIALLTADDEDDEEGYDRRGLYIAASGSYARGNFTDSSVYNLFDGELRHNLRVLRRIPQESVPQTDPPTILDAGIYFTKFGDFDDTDAFGFTGRGGYRCHPRVSVELQADWFNDFGSGSIVEIGETPLIVETSTGPLTDTLRNFKFDLESLVMTTNVKGHLMTGRYQPFVLGGLGFMRMETKARDVTPSADATTEVCQPPLTDPCRAPHASDRRVEIALRLGGGLDFYLTENVVITAEGSYLMPTGKLDGLDYYTFAVGLQYRF
jgi:opacity protein-like surface antigen